MISNRRQQPRNSESALKEILSEIFRARAAAKAARALAMLCSPGTFRMFFSFFAFFCSREKCLTFFTAVGIVMPRDLFIMRVPSFGKWLIYF